MAQRRHRIPPPENFDGPVTHELRNALVEYGYAVIGAWLNPKTDRMYLEANAKGFGIADYAKRWMFTPDHRHDLQVDVVVTSVPTFLSDVLAKGRWDHRKGASIKTFFIGWCVMQFRNVFRKFLRDHESEFVRHAGLDTEGHDRSWGGNPASIITAGRSCSPRSRTKRHERSRCCEQTDTAMPRSPICSRSPLAWSSPVCIAGSRTTTFRGVA